MDSRRSSSAWPSWRPVRGVGQVAAQLAGNARGQQRFLQVARQAFEDRRQQIGADRLLVAVEQGHFLRLRLLAQPQADEMHAHHPAFGLAIERLQAGLVQIETAALEVFAGFLEAEAQPSRPISSNSPLARQVARLSAGCERVPRARTSPGGAYCTRAVEAGEDVRVANQVQVVEHQQQRAAHSDRDRRAGFRSPPPPGPAWCSAGRSGRRRQAAARLRPAPRSAAGRNGRVVVFFGKREPGHRLVCCSALPGQGGERAGLAEAGRCGKHQNA